MKNSDIIIALNSIVAKNPKNLTDEERNAFNLTINIIKDNVTLKHENAALQKRLDNAVELPCKVGDTVFTVFEDKIKECKVTEIRFISNLLGNTWAISGYSTETNITLQLVDCHFRVWWFTDRAEAEARLAELKGGKQ